MLPWPAQLSVQKSGTQQEEQSAHSSHNWVHLIVPLGSSNNSSIAGDVIIRFWSQWKVSESDYKYDFWGQQCALIFACVINI